MLSDEEKSVLHKTWEMVVPIGDTAADLFYRRLFQLEPKYRDLFPEDLGPQKKKFLSMLAFIVRATDWKVDEWEEEVPTDEDLFFVVMALGRRHHDLYQVPKESYAVVREALLWTLDYGLGDAFTDPVRDVWGKLYDAVSAIMLMSAGSKGRG